MAGVSLSRGTVMQSQGGIEGERAAVRNDQSQGAPIAGYGSLKYEISVRRGLKQLVMGSKLHICYWTFWVDLIRYSSIRRRFKFNLMFDCLHFHQLDSIKCYKVSFSFDLPSL